LLRHSDPYIYLFVITGADIRTVCTEAGMYAIPARRKTVTENDFLDAVNKIKSSTLERTNAAAPHHPDASGRDAGARLGAGGYGFSVTNSTLSPKEIW